jgi:hypothetical protein
LPSSRTCRVEAASALCTMTGFCSDGRR